MSDEKIRVIVSGALGRTGSVVAEAIGQTSDMELVGGVEAPDKLSEVPGFRLFSKPSEGIADVLVDFTQPEASLSILEDGASAGMGLVVGTTGFSGEQTGRIKRLSESVPIVISANMSLGVNLMLGLVHAAATHLSGYDIEITETHHKHKKDSPSGTAKTLFESIKCVRPELRPVGNRSWKREPDEIGIFSLRGGEVFGEHSVFFMGEGEVLEITHRVLSRRCFAR
ncbi:MAG: 4-hydroxy-tetrahydrodipicolinate reductase, partial [Candidatus Hydrothermia bacterium]